MNHRNTQTGAIHIEGPGGFMVLCSIKIRQWFEETTTPPTCEGCKRIARQYTYKVEDDPVYQLTEEIGNDLPDGAFWALYNELGRL